jgi:hypothetical protein
MNIVAHLKDIHIDHIQFLDTKENIMKHGNFTKVIYSDDLIIIKGIYIHLPLQIKTINKNIAFFDIQENRPSIDAIMEFEKKILQHYKEYLKICYNDERLLKLTPISWQLIKSYNNNTMGSIKLNSFSENRTEIIFQPQNPVVLKIAGVWEDNYTMGITYKFLQMNAVPVYPS